MRSLVTSVRVLAVTVLINRLGFATAFLPQQRLTLLHRLFRSENDSGHFDYQIYKFGLSKGDDDSTTYGSKAENSYAANRARNEQWLYERFNFPKEKFKQQSHNLLFLTQDNGTLEERVDSLHRA